MPTIKEILQEERSRESTRLVLFLEGKFWKAYESSAYVLTKLYNFKPSKRYIKLVGEEIISVGFPKEQLSKYLSNAVIEANGKMCRAVVQCSQDEHAFGEWKESTRIKETKRKLAENFDVPEEWRPKTQVFREENLPVFKMVYDLMLRLFHETGKMSKDSLKKYALLCEQMVMVEKNLGNWMKYNNNLFNNNKNKKNEEITLF